MPRAPERPARSAVSVLFVVNGALFANLVPRFPEIKTDLGLSDTGFGLSVAAFSAGALLAGLTAGRLLRRFGSADVAVLSSLLLALCGVLAGTAPTAALFATAMLCAGAADAVTDVAQNAQGLTVQRRYGRSIINSLHAAWSVGAIVGGGIGAAALAFEVPRIAQLGMSAAFFGGLCLLAWRRLLPDADTPPSTSATPAGFGVRGGMRRGALLTGLALLAVAGAIIEDAGSSWATLYLGRDLGAGPALAASGFIAMVGCQFIGRMLGDRLVDRYSQRAVVRAGGLIAATGMGVALAVPTVPLTILGFALAGFGVATVAPAAFQGADSVPGLRPGTGLTVVTWFMRIGFLTSPALVGALADATALRTALLTMVAAGLTIALLAGALRPLRAPATGG